MHPATIVAQPERSRALGLQGDAAALRRQMDRWGKQVDAAIAARMEKGFARASGIAPLREVCCETKAFVVRPGKRIRPLLFLAAYDIFASDLAPSERVGERGLLDVALALELLHAFILVHDDIVDASDERRGLPALHRCCQRGLGKHPGRESGGAGMALVAGDLLFTLAQSTVLEAALPDAKRLSLCRLLLEYMADTGTGELADIRYGLSDISKVTRQQVEEMNWLKTTRYTIECPLLMAAELAGIPAREHDALRAAARPLGLAFQLENDLRDFARHEQTESGVPDDIAEGKKTLLLCEAFSRLSETDRGLLQLGFGQACPSEGAFLKVCELVRKSGAPAAIRAEIGSLLVQCGTRIVDCGLPAGQRAALAGLVRHLTSIVS